MSLPQEIARLSSAYFENRLIDAPSQPPSLSDAYAIQDGFIATLEQSGMTRVGAKIGLSAPAALAALGLEEPVSGLLYDAMHLTDGAELPAGPHVHPHAEAEICFRLGADLDDPNLSEADAIAAIDQIMPSIELVNSRFKDWAGKPMDMVAENVSSGWFVTGTPAEGIDPKTLGEATMQMFVNGEVVAEGQGSATHGGPLLALIWLARNLAKRGHPLKAGDYVMSGTFAAKLPVAAGSDLRVEIAGVGSVSVKLGA